MMSTVSKTVARPVVKACHVCEGSRVHYLFSARSHRVVRCEDCGLVFLNPQPADDELACIYGANYFLGSDSDAGVGIGSGVKKATARLYLSEILRYSGTETGRLLEVGSGDGESLAEAESAGWNVTGVELSSIACEKARRRLKRGSVICGELQGAMLESNCFDLCVVSDVLEHVRSPGALLREIHRVLKPGGTLFVATPSLDSWSARLLRQKWMEFKPEHLTYFDRQTLQTALFKSGFRKIILQPGWKILNFEYMRQHFERFPVPILTPFFCAAVRVLPRKVRLKHRRIVASGIMAFAQKSELRPQPVLSVIVPVYNEAATFRKLMDSLVLKEITGVRMEIILVESHSTDGTREAALDYASHPKVKLVLEGEPQGKGHAVRAGLEAATGDLVLIQDADLEYDIEDYDALIEHLLSGHGAFVLGSRHGGRNVLKMRQFIGQRSLSLIFNAGHWFFTALINLLFLLRLRDPFTMFKVFRRDCLHGLEFECDRFDFDFELLLKLARKGFIPVELPVNYKSRSYGEGKKVRLFRDPLTWLAVLAKLRFARIDPMTVIERQRRMPGPRG